jgi:hypothetical protein
VGPIIIPPAVAREVFGDEAPPAWVQIVAPRGAAPEVGSVTLGAGEREAIALAIEVGCRRLLLDDLPARRLAARKALPVSGSVAVLLAAKSAGVIERVAPLIDALQVAGFHLSAEVRAAALHACGEGEGG